MKSIALAPLGMVLLAGSSRAEETITVPSDPGVGYFVVELSSPGQSLAHIITRREGRSGTSYANREVNCPNLTFRYLGEGDTLEEARDTTYADKKFGPLVDGSISDVISRYACSKLGL